MKIHKQLLIILVLGVVITTLVGCGSDSDEESAELQLATVTRGDISLEITAAGNLALSKIEDLAVELAPLYTSGTKATIGEVLVAVGDAVTEGQLLVTIDKSEWADQLTTLQDSVTTAQRSVTAKQRALATANRAVTTKENAVVTAQRLVITKEMAVAEAELDVTAANLTLYRIEEVKEVQDEIDNLEFIIQYATLAEMGAFGQPNFDFWAALIVQAKIELLEAQSELQELLGGTSTLTSDDVALQIAQAQLGIKKAQMDLEDARIAVENAEKAVISAQQDVEDAKLDVEDAQTALDDANRDLTDAQDTFEEAQTVSPEIVAPFDGFVTAVNVAGGDEVLNGTVLVQIADPNKFEVEILVSEMDILNLAIGTNGTMTADAIPDVNFPVKVTWISPTATISASIVNYPVTVEVTSLMGVSTTQTASLPMLSGNFTPPEGFSPTANFTPSADFTPPDIFPGSDNSSLEAMIPPTGNTAAKEYTLKSGMTITVTLTIQLSTDVLLVPSSAITSMGGMSFVEVMSANGTAERRIIVTGNTDYTNTEVISGLSEGDTVIIPTGTSYTEMTTDFTPGQRDEFIMMDFSGGPPG
jgi:multidrug efflux pump subunit AcrA (membrane-fusion protein)